MPSLVILVIILFFTHTCQCHIYSPGNCPSVSPIPDFNMTKFLGRWYAMEKTTTKSSCLIYNFKEGTKSGEYFLEQTSEGYPTQLNLSYIFDYTGKIKADKNSSTMSIHFPLNVAGSASFDVVTTDYETYAGIYTCQNLLFFKRQSATFLSRTNRLDGSNILQKLSHAFDEKGLNDLHLNGIRHDNCNEANGQILLTVKSNLASSINFSRMIPTIPGLAIVTDSDKKSNRRIADVSYEVETVDSLTPIEPTVEKTGSDIGENIIEPRLSNSEEAVQE